MFLKSTNSNKIEKLLAKSQLAIFIIVGLAPITPTNVKKLNTNIFKFSNSRFNTSYNLVFTIFVFAINISQFFNFNEEDLQDETTLTKVIVLCANFNLLVAEIGILTYYCLKRLSIEEIANKIVNFDVIATRLIEHRSQKIINYCSYLYLLIHIILMINTIVFQGVSEGLSFSWGSVLLAVIIITYFIVQYSLVLNLLLYRLRNFNNAFNTITRTPKYSSQPDSIFSFKVKVCKSDELLITRFMEVHEVLYDIIYDVAQFYSFPIFMAIGATIFSVILSTYWLIMPFAASTWRSVPIINHVNGFVWLLLEMLPIFFLTNTVTKLNLQMRRTKDILHKFSDNFMIDGAQKSKMEIFSLILNHRKVNFNAYYIIDIDNSLLNKIFLIVATYVIVIIQFQIEYTDN